MFRQLKQQVRESFGALSKQELFYVNIDREEIWDQYLSGFTEAVRQEHNCNCCKSFLRQYAGIVAIIDNKKVSIWDKVCEELTVETEEYHDSIQNLRRYVDARPITGVFRNPFASCGTDKNLDSKKNITWEHFHITLPNKFLRTGDVDAYLGECRTTKEVLKRSLDELKIDATKAVLELIDQNSLYRGKEHEATLNKFLALQQLYKNIPVELKDNYCWEKSTILSAPITRIRNTSIGTLLVDLSEGIELDDAVTKFERMVAPSNYKRPTALVTPKMIEQAKEKLNELGLIGSLERRFAQETDLTIDDILYTDKSSSVTDVFNDMSKGTVINPRSFTKIEEVSINDFIEKIVPTAKVIEVLVEDGHMSNMVSLIAPIDKEAKTLFKWNNGFSWSYAGGITDSMKERVKAAGGNVEGVLRYSIQWNENEEAAGCDLDAHAYEPNGEHIYYSSPFRKDRGNQKTSMTGQLDVDIIHPHGVAVENIVWTDVSKMREGDYTFAINNYNHGRNGGFSAQIEFDGQIYNFGQSRHHEGMKTVAIVNYSKKNGFSLTKTVLDAKSSVSSKDKWNVKTNTFTRVKKLMLSPNYWRQQVGNKHFFFFLENCISDESPRPFFNEFLKPEFDENRKVFEILGGKLRIEATNNQLSGVGFSETQRNHLICKVTGTFSRTLKINF
jgi:hypothetical protein